VLAGSKVPSISIKIDIFKHDGKWLIKHTYRISKAMPAEEHPWRHHTTAQSQGGTSKKETCWGKKKNGKTQDEEFKQNRRTGLEEMEC
jgi:NADH:ubiquinone oxidoreductase subunit